VDKWEDQTICIGCKKDCFGFYLKSERCHTEGILSETDTWDSMHKSSPFFLLKEGSYPLTLKGALGKKPPPAFFLRFSHWRRAKFFQLPSTNLHLLVGIHSKDCGVVKKLRAVIPVKVEKVVPKVYSVV
jgi:hypothetical protein